MKWLFPYLIIIAIAVMSVSSCKKSARDVYAEAVEEWIGKEILFPDSMMTVTGEMIAPPTADFTIVSYYDSTGCTGCRMKLPFWNEFMNKVRSNNPDLKVSLYMVVSTKDKDELNHLIKKFKFSYPIAYDPYNRMGTLNRFLEDSRLQTFLIDRNNTVVAIGNSLETKDMEDFYLHTFFSGDEGSHDPDFRDTYEFDFGKINPGQLVSHDFNLKNNTDDTIKVMDLVTSCECINASVSQKVIPPKTDFRVSVNFQDTVIGDFFRSASLLLDSNKPEIRFEVSGVIK